MLVEGVSEAKRLFAPGNLRKTAADIAAGGMTCVEVLENCLTHIGEAEPHVKALLHLDPQLARSCASKSDERRRTGRGLPLDGVAVVVKDIVDVRGMPTTAGSRVPDPRLAGQDAEIVARLRAAGANIVGKANTHEFAFGATTPPTRNPNLTCRIAGGSSGGSAAAVAAGMALLAVGTDTGGSVRLPAALCGIAGLRPRAGRIGMGGIIPLAREFDVWGLLAPTAADLEFVWSSLGLCDAGGEDVIRLAVPSRLAASVPEMDTEIAEIFEAAVRAGAAAGVKIENVVIPDLRQWQSPRMSIQLREALHVHRDYGWWPARWDDYSEEVRLNLEFAESKEDEPLDAARTRLAELDQAIDQTLSTGAVLCIPTVPVAAPSVGELARMPRQGFQRHPIVSLLACCTLPFSRGELASLTIPCGTTRAGLPAGLQLIAGTESAVLRAGTMLENLFTNSAALRPH